MYLIDDYCDYYEIHSCKVESINDHQVGAVKHVPEFSISDADAPCCQYYNAYYYSRGVEEESEVFVNFRKLRTKDIYHINAAGERKRVAASIMANIPAVWAFNSESIKKVEMHTIRFITEKIIKQGRAFSFLRSMTA